MKETKLTSQPIKIHSCVDLITNSSTTIFCISDASKQAAIDMINCFLKAFNIEKSAEEMFIFQVMMDSYNYIDYYSEQAIGDMSRDEVRKLIDDVTKGLIEKPEWMQNAEDSNSDDISYDTMLYITPKSIEYEELGNKIHSFLYSTNHEASNDY